MRLLDVESFNLTLLSSQILGKEEQYSLLCRIIIYSCKVWLKNGVIVELMDILSLFTANTKCRFAIYKCMCVNALNVGRSMTSTGIVIVTGKAVSSCYPQWDYIYIVELF